MQIYSIDTKELKTYLLNLVYDSKTNAFMSIYTNKSLL